MWVCRGTRVGTVGFYKKEGEGEAAAPREAELVREVLNLLQDVAFRS